jgi:hypothetical protein
MVEHFLRVLLLAAFCLASWSGPVAECARAQQDEAADASPRPASDSRGTAFRAVPGAAVEQTSGLLLVVAAYGLIWFLLLAYVLRLARLQAVSEREQRRLERLLAPENRPRPDGEGGQRT